MKIILAGGSGLIGRHLGRALAGDGHEVWVLSRNPQLKRFPEGVQGAQWDGKTSQGWVNLLEGAGALINLASESIGEWPWTEEKKHRILSSRVTVGQAIVEAMTQAKNGPKVLLQASAIGCYGTSLVQTFDETAPFGEEFQSRICKEWEASTAGVEVAGVRRVILRTGLYLTPEGGILPKIALPFRLFVGGPLGSGKQWYSWIHPQDWMAAVQFLLANEQAAGPYNLTSPMPVKMAEFGRTLAVILHRPYLAPAPAFALRLVLGEMSTLVLDGQRVVPRRLIELGFKFRYERLHDALENLLKH